MNYIIWANIYLTSFYGFYWFLMRKETFFELKRFYLMTSILLSFSIPILDLTRYYWKNEGKLFSINLDFEAQVSQVITEVEIRNPSWFDSISALPILLLIYFAGCLFFSVKLIIQILTIKKGLRETKTGQAYSFFHHIHVDSSIGNHSKVVEHEEVHVKQFHSVDVLIIELVKIFNWFNPIIYMMARSAKLNHEYIADAHITNSGNERIHYAESLLSKAFESTNCSLKNNFIYESFIKNRITMLFKKKTKKSVLSRFLVLVPLLTVLISFQSKNSDLIKKSEDDQMLAMDLLKEYSSETVSHPNDTTLINDRLFTAVEVPPVPPKGMTDFLKEVADQYKIPEAIVAAGKSGRLLMSFIVEKDGTLSSIKALKDLGSGTAEEALRVLENSPKWTAGMQNGRRVRVEYTLPIMIDVSKKEGPTIPSPKDETETTQDHPIKTGNSSSSMALEDIDQRPQPQEGMTNFLRYIGQNYAYPKEAEIAKVKGRVVVTFVVERDGSLTDVKIVRDLGYGTGEEAVRVIQNSEKWKPGYHNGEAVRVQYTLPIVLNMNTDTVSN